MPLFQQAYVAATTDPIFGNEVMLREEPLIAFPFSISSFPFSLSLQQLFSYNWTSASWSNIADLKAEGVYTGAREDGGEEGELVL